MDETERLRLVKQVQELLAVKRGIIEALGILSTAEEAIVTSVILGKMLMPEQKPMPSLAALPIPMSKSCDYTLEHEGKSFHCIMYEGHMGNHVVNIPDEGKEV